MSGNIYEPLSEPKLKDKTNGLVSQFIKYAYHLGLAPQDISIKRSYLPLILQRVHKRKKYFHYFHAGMKMNEVKRAALVAYWVLKFRPFSYCGDAQNEFPLNEGFAFFYILSVCQKCADIHGVDSRRPSDELVYEMMYAFKYWDLNKEAIILMAEIIAESFFGVPTQATKEA